MSQEKSCSIAGKAFCAIEIHVNRRYREGKGGITPCQPIIRCPGPCGIAIDCDVG